VASGQARDLPRRHGLISRAGVAVRGFAARRLAVHRLLRPRRHAAPVGADVVGALPVRPPWTALTWMRLHATPSTMVGSTVDTRPGRVVRPPRRAGSTGRAAAMRRGERSAPGTQVHARPSTLAGRPTGTRPRAGAGAPPAGPGTAGPLAAAAPGGASGAAGPFGIGLLDGGLPGGRLFGPAGLATDSGTALAPALGGPASFSAFAGTAGSGTASLGRLGTGSIDVRAAHSGNRYQTDVVRNRLQVRLTVGQVLPAGARVGTVTLDGAPARYTVTDTHRGREVLVPTPSAGTGGQSRLVVTTIG